jgi:hypothetical protein
MYDAGMLSDLAAVIDELDLRPDGEAIALAIRLRDVLDAKISRAVGIYDARALYERDGAVSAAGWLKQSCGMSGPAAASLVRLTRRLCQLPVTNQAWLDGALSGGQVQAIVANVDDATVDQLVAQEVGLVPFLVPLTVADTAHAMRIWKYNADLLTQDVPPRDQERTAHLSRLLDGRGRLDADLDAEGMAIAEAALRLAESPDAEGEERRAAERRGDALVDALRFFLDHQHDSPKSRNRPHLSAIVDWSRFERGHGGETIDGVPLSPATIQRTLCDADVSRVVTDGRSTVIDLGTTTRVVPSQLFLALVLRDRHCRHPGCDRPPQWCEAHHVIPVSRAGPTVLWNLALKCTRHHHIGHLPGWTEKLETDGTLHVTAPDGRSWTTTPPGVLSRLSE